MNSFYPIAIELALWRFSHCQDSGFWVVPQLSGMSNEAGNSISNSIGNHDRWVTAISFGVCADLVWG